MDQSQIVRGDEAQPDQRPGSEPAQHNLHCIQADERVREAYDNATAVMVCGWPIAMLAGCRIKQRVAWLDALPDLCTLAERMGWLIYHVGNEPGVFPRARQKLLERFPDLRMAGQNGHFDQTPGSAESRTTVELINWHQPQIVTVDMGMPTEAIDAHRHLIHAPAVIQVGATMDYFGAICRCRPGGWARSGSNLRSVWPPARTVPGAAIWSSRGRSWLTI